MRNHLFQHKNKEYLPGLFCKCAVHIVVWVWVILQIALTFQFYIVIADYVCSLRWLILCCWWHGALYHPDNKRHFTLFTWRDPWPPLHVHSCSPVFVPCSCLPNGWVALNGLKCVQVHFSQGPIINYYGDDILCIPESEICVLLSPAQVSIGQLDVTWLT